MIGKRVRAYRKAKGLSQQKLADKMGWSRQEISRYETGTIKRPTLEFMQDVAKALEVRVEELTDDEKGGNENVSNTTDERDDNGIDER